MAQISSITTAEILKKNIKLTPMMEQYFAIKKNYKDTLLLFRMGDFYEVFFEDAVNASKILNIALTHRGKVGDFPIPMAGIPHHAASTYIDRITSRGLRAAICEQIEDPKMAKGIVKRAVTQIVSPAMPFDLDKSEASSHHFMCSGIKESDHYFLSVIDFTTGLFRGHVFHNEEEFLDKIRVYSPKEFLCYLGQWDNEEKVDQLLSHLGSLKTHLSEEYFNPKFTALYTKRLIPTFQKDGVIQGAKAILYPVGALSYYICSTQSLEEFYHIQPFRLISEKGVMKVTKLTLTGLEILPKNHSEYKDSLIGFMDKTQSAMGSRALKEVFLTPSTDLDSINKRHELISFFIKNITLTEEIRRDLSETRDLERILAKVSTGKANSSDLINLSKSTDFFFIINDKLKKAPKGIAPNFQNSESNDLVNLATNIQKTINDELSASLDKGNLIKDGANPKRDRLAHLKENAAEELLKLEAKYREETGINNLKVKYNNVAGYFIEISKSHTSKVPKHFERRQTLVNCERYMSDELLEFEKEMITAKDKLLKLEREIFQGILKEVSDKSVTIQKLAQALSLIDVYQSLAWIAYQEDFKKPDFTTDRKIEITNSWHPLIKNMIKDEFVPHNLYLDENKYFGLITGPNMAGKTTVMREVAIVQFLAQIGSFVPAEKVTLSICDHIFSRLGASDDILKGQSTFMVEMAETAEILRHATENSLIILDELGRGTSTYDGLSIAWALVEYFVNKTKAFTLFATHYHELIDLADSLKEAKNLTVETHNDNGDVHFLYRLIEKAANQSFGIYVAKLAGLPKSVLKRSEHILRELEKGHQSKNKKSLEYMTDEGKQLSFIEDHLPNLQIPEYLENIEKSLEDLDVEKITPLQALNKLHQLKELIIK